MIRIHKEGRLLIPGFFVGLAGLWYGLYWLGLPQLIMIFLGAAGIIFFGLILNFFRNPKRNSPQDDNIVLAPADGKVLVIEETVEEEYFKDQRIQISIFMSPLDVHVNRSPIKGRIEYAKYHPGKYLVAWHPKSSTANERNTVVVLGAKGPVLMRQIAGAVARRISFYKKSGDQTAAGGELGFIRFGSRVDVFLPVGAIIKVDLNQAVVGGESVLAEL